MPAGGGVAGKPVSHRGRCSYTEHIGEARAHCRSTRPGCECLPAAAELPANPFRTEGGAPTHNISEKPEPTVGAPAPGANASRRRSCRQPGSHRRRCFYTKHIGEARTTVGAPVPGANASRRRRGCRQPGSHRGGAPTWGMARVYGVQLGVKAYPMTPPLLTLYTWRL